MIEKNENLTDTIQMPLIRLVSGFKLALQAEDYELCGKIKDEMDRREHLYGINKTVLRKILNYIAGYPEEGSLENKQHFDAMFEKYF